MRIRKLAHLQAYARTMGIIVERKGKTYETYHKDNHGTVGVTDSLEDCQDELYDFIPKGQKATARV